MRLAALLVGLTLACGAVRAEAPPEVQKIAEARAMLEEARADLEAARGQQAKLKALGRAVSAHEAALGALRSGLLSLLRAEREVTGRLEAERERLAALLAALQSLSRAPSSALLADPGGPLRAARSGMMMAELTPAIDERLRLLGGELDTLRTLRVTQESARGEARAALATLQDLRSATTQALAGRAPRSAIASRAVLAEQAERAAQQADDLASLAKVLAEALSTGGTPRAVPFAPARGEAPLPVTGGHIVARFGEPDPWGHPGTGISVEAPAFAQIFAPWDATVRFAGDLIDYGKVIALEPEEGYLILVAGLKHIDRTVGEAVLAGERLGDLGGPVPTSEEFLRVSGQDVTPLPTETFYIEIRHDGAAVDPAPWFE